MKTIKVAIIGDSKSPNLQRRVEKLSSYAELEIKVFDNAYIRYKESRVDSKFFRILKKIPKATTIIWLLWRFKKLNIFSPDVTFVMFSDPYSLLVTQFLNTGKIISTWGSDILPKQGAMSRHFDRIVSKRAMIHADQIYCVSQQLKEEVVKLTDGKLSVSPFVLHYGIDLKFYDWERLKHKPTIEVNGEKKIVIFSPRWCLPVYNIEGIMDAFNRLCKQFNSVILRYREVDLLNTDKAISYHVSIEKKIKKAGTAENVIKLGLQGPKECLLTYQSSHIVISLARSDGTPISALEAMAAGCIVVCNRIPSLEKIIDHGKNGFLVDGENPKEVAELLQFIIKNYDEIHEEIGKNARTYVEKFGNMHHEIEHYVQCIKTLNSINK